MNPLETLLQQLAQQAGPRGSTFAGRVIPQGQTPDLRQLMTQVPTESPDAEGMGAMLAAGPLAQKMLMPPKPYMKLGKPGVGGFETEKYPFDLEVRVTTGPGDEAFIDNIKGLNRGHAAARARSNWQGMSTEYLEGNKIIK